MRILFVIGGISFLALIAGGVFVSRQFYTEQPVPFAEPISESAPESVLEPIPEPENKTLTEQAEELIGESRALIAEAQKFIAQESAKKALIETALEKSSRVKGSYAGAAYNRAYFKNLLDETSLNSLVIDVKEAYGTNLPVSLKSFIEELHQKNVWVIARMVVFRDNSLASSSPEWHLATSSEGFWLDPSLPEVRDYIIDFSKKVIDFGFDELQFDYIRFPADGINFHQGEERYKIIGDFFGQLSKTLKEYKPSIILSVDLFGYVASQYQAFDIGQRLIDAAFSFDYISPMLYPSHFYGGFRIDEDSKRGLPALSLPYKSEDINEVVSNNPYAVVLRSILAAVDYLDSLGSAAKIRPWLQDFNLTADTSRGIFYDAEKVKAQIQAAADANSSGWLLWNPSNIYTKEALTLQ